MNWLGALNLGFLSPAWLALVPFVGALLVFAYLRRGKGRQVKVGTLFLLRSLKRPVFSRKKFRPPLRFYVELLLLLLLILGAAGLYKQGMGTRIAVLVDNSFSMARVQPGDSEGKDLLALAVRDASSIVRSFSSESRIEVFATSPHLVSVSGSLARPDKALQDLKTIELAYAADNVEAAAQKLLGDPSYERVFVFTERGIERRDESGRLDVRTTLQGVKGENVAISHMALRSGSPRNSIEVSVAAFLQSQSSIKVILDVVESEGSSAKYKKLAEKSVQLNGRAHETVVFNDINPGLRVFRARLEPDRQGLSITFDAIRQDDMAWLSVEAQGGKVALVSQFSPLELGLSNLRIAQFSHVRPEDYERDPQAISQKNYSGAIFHRYVPQTLPQVSSVFIAPVSASDFLQPIQVISDVELTRWIGTQPVLNYLNMPSLKLGKATVLSVPPWGEELISSTRGPIAFAGQTEQRKYVAIGFELLPFEGKKSTLNSILTLNILKYITELGADVGFQMVGSKLFVPAEASRVYYLDGNELAQTKSKAEAEQNIFALRPGIVAVDSPLSGTTLHAFDYYDENESDTLTAVSFALDFPKVDPVERRDTSLLSGRIAELVALVLLLDLLFLSGLLSRLRPSGDAA